MICLAALALCACATISTAEVQAYLTGRALVTGRVGSDLDFCTGYIAGVVDVFSAVNAGTGNPKFQASRR